MDRNLTLEYDQIGDILYVQTCPPYREQDSDELGDSVVGRMNPVTGEIEALEILFFMARFKTAQSIDLPVKAKLLLAEALDV